MGSGASRSLTCVLWPEGGGRVLVALERGGPVDRLQHQVVEHEPEIERGVAGVGNLEVDQPHRVTLTDDEDVLPRRISVHEAQAAVEHLLDDRAE